MLYKEIPTTAFEFKPGLYINEYNKTIGQLSWVIWELFSQEGYCFYDLQIPENYDENKQLLKNDDLIYYTHSIMRKNEQYVNDNIHSVVRQDNYNIA